MTAVFLFDLLVVLMALLTLPRSPVMLQPGANIASSSPRRVRCFPGVPTSSDSWGRATTFPAVYAARCVTFSHSVTRPLHVPTKVRRISLAISNLGGCPSSAAERDSMPVWCCPVLVSASSYSSIVVLLTKNRAVMKQTLCAFPPRSLSLKFPFFDREFQVRLGRQQLGPGHVTFSLAHPTRHSPLHHQQLRMQCRC